MRSITPPDSGSGAFLGTPAEKFKSVSEWNFSGAFWPQLAQGSSDQRYRKRPDYLGKDVFWGSVSLQSVRTA